MTVPALREGSQIAKTQTVQRAHIGMNTLSLNSMSIRRTPTKGPLELTGRIYLQGFLEEYGRECS